MGYKLTMTCDECGRPKEFVPSTWHQVTDVAESLLLNVASVLEKGCLPSCEPKIFCPSCKHKAPTGPHPSHEVH